MDDIDTINASLSVERGVPEGSPTYDPEEPRWAHDSHDWQPRERWLECSRCGTRDHWPASEVRCKVPHGKAAVISLEEASAALLADLEAFFQWWLDSAHPPMLPSFDEWAANFHEWRIERS